MKKDFFIATYLLIVSVAFAQAGKKPKEKPPTQKEMKEMQQAMDEISAEDKRMPDTSALKYPVFTEIIFNHI